MILSLKNIALRKVAITLWCQPNILASGDFYDVEFQVVRNIGKLELPAVLCQGLKVLVKPIGSTIRDWKKYHEVYLEIGNIHIYYMLKHLCWTRLGIIDYKKTAEKIVRLEILDIVRRYRLACLYCLDDCISFLYVQLSMERKVFFYDSDDDITSFQLDFYWPRHLFGQGFEFESYEHPFGEFSSLQQFAFECSAYKGNKSAAAFFFHLIPNDDKYDSLYRMAHEVAFHRCRETEYQIGSEIDNFPEKNLSDVFCFLISLMDPQQQEDNLKEQPCQALACLLDWPWQDLFMDVAKFVWDFLDPDEFVFLIHVIAERIEAGYSYLTELFHEFYWRGNNDFIKEFVETESQSASVLETFFRVQDSESIQVIFRKLNSFDRKIIVSGSEVFHLFYKAIRKGLWDLVELCLEEATLSKADKEELKKNYFVFLSEDSHHFIRHGRMSPDAIMKERENVWEQFLQFFD